jgi:hypothetical protein
MDISNYKADPQPAKASEISALLAAEPKTLVVEPEVGKPWTYAQFADAISKADDAQVAGLMFDEAKGVLPPDQINDLDKVYTRRFPGD